MTKEVRTLIDLKDILGVEIECKNLECRAKMMLPISSKILDDHYRCFQCGKDWFGARLDAEKGAPVAAAIAQINELMRAVALLSSKDRSDVLVPIRLHIRNAD